MRDSLKPIFLARDVFLAWDRGPEGQLGELEMQVKFWNRRNTCTMETTQSRLYLCDGGSILGPARSRIRDAAERKGRSCDAVLLPKALSRQT